MALIIEGEEQLEASAQRIWDALNDPAVLKRCIPGCDQLEKLSESEFHAIVALKIGPIKAKFAGHVALSNCTPPYACTISGEGKGGIAGFAKGNAEVRLTEGADGRTLLQYKTTADIGGKMAQLGNRMIGSVVKSLSAQFFSTLRDDLKLEPNQT